MLKNQKGITAIMLVITIIVLSILAGITIRTTTDLIRSSENKSRMTVMSLVKVEVEKIYENYDFSGGTKQQTLDTSLLRVNNTATQANSSSFITKLPANEQQALNAELSKARSQGVEADNLWYTWGSGTFDYLKLDDQNMLNEGKFYVNYAIGEVVYQLDAGEAHTLTGLLGG